MGLDQYAHSGTGEDIAYWRKHNRLQGWMERLWHEKCEKYKNRPIEERFIDAIDSDDNKPDGGAFNCKDLPLTAEDIDRLEKDIKDRNLPETEGFFFGSDSYEDYEKHHLDEDLKFIDNAREYLARGEQVIYSCWY